MRIVVHGPMTRLAVHRTASVTLSLSERTYVFPLMEIWQVDASTHVYMSTRFDLHVGCRLDVDHWWVIGVSVQQPQTHGNVVCTT